jgi:hypothetical protein
MAHAARCFGHAGLDDGLSISGHQASMVFFSIPGLRLQD